MHDYGMQLGMAFQIMDDALDYTADADTMGKNAGDDFADQEDTPTIRHGRMVMNRRAFWQRTLGDAGFDGDLATARHCWPADAIDRAILRAQALPSRPAMPSRPLPPTDRRACQRAGEAARSPLRTSNTHPRMFRRRAACRRYAARDDCLRCPPAVQRLGCRQLPAITGNGLPHPPEPGQALPLPLPARPPHRVAAAASRLGSAASIPAGRPLRVAGRNGRRPGSVMMVVPRWGGDAQMDLMMNTRSRLHGRPLVTGPYRTVCRDAAADWDISYRQVPLFHYPKGSIA